jgi:hypothetical protein
MASPGIDMPGCACLRRCGLPGEDHDGLNLRREAIWENTDEGQRALNDEKQRIREGMKPQNVTRAGWET